MRILALRRLTMMLRLCEPEREHPGKGCPEISEELTR